MDPTNGRAIDPAQLDQLAINTVRFLSVDAVQKANSGHPGLPLGAAPMAYVLWTRFLRHNPANPHWFNRDRFVLSAGHGSMLLYSLLHLTGYDLPLEQIKQFRQWGSMTPGHPERGIAPGVEATTGPLGQGFGNGVGMAIADAIGTNLVVAVQGFGFVDELRRLAAKCDFPISIEPKLFMRWGKLTDPFPHGIVHPGLLFKCGVDFDESVVGRLAGGVEDHLDDAEAFVHRVEQAVIEHIAFVTGLLLFISRNRQQAAPVALGQQADQYAHRGKQNQGNGIRGLRDCKTEWRQNRVVRYQDGQEG